MKRILRHVGGKDFRKTHQRCLDEQRVLYLEKRERQIQELEEAIILKELSEPYKSNWRNDINEGMTSSGSLFTTLSATGDADLVPVDVSSSSSYSFSSNISYSASGVSLNSYGDTPYATTIPIDTSTSDSISFSGFANPNFSTNSDLELFWYNNDTGEYGYLTGIERTSTSSASYNVNIPLAARGKSVDFTFFQNRVDSADFVGKPIYIGGQLAQLYPGRSSSGLASAIVQVLVNYGIPGRSSILDLGRNIMVYVSQNPSTVSGYENIFGRYDYPGLVGPVSGNIGDPNIRGFNSDLVTLQNSNSAAFIHGYLSSYTSQQVIDLFADTDMNASALNSELFTYWDKSTSRDIYYTNYVEADSAGNTSSANYWLGLYNNMVPQASAAETAVKNRINNARPLPDSKWTDADIEKVATDVYNFYKDAKTYTITNFSTKRRTPVNVFVALDSPEATSFIRTDPIMQGLSADERRKKLEDMLDAGDEYLMKQVGLQGSTARPADTGNVQSWEQATGDEIAQTLPFPSYPAGPSGFDRKPGTYAPNNIIPIGGPGTNWRPGEGFDIINPFEGSPATTPGLSQQGNQDTQIAVSYPQDPKWMRDLQKGYDEVKDKPFNPGTPKPGRGMGDTWEGPPIKGASKKNANKLQIAHYEPQGQVISEKKLRSPKQVLKDKIPGYYDGKPSPLGFPDNPPPEMVNGMHPDLVDGKKVADRFNRLDSQSAQAMPLTGNPHIDKKVLKARKQPK